MLKDIRKNPIMLTDCYNTSHQELKESTDFEVSHIYNRGNGMFLYGFIEQSIETILSVKYTKEMVEDAFKSAKLMGLVFPYDMWMSIVNDYDGRLPLKVECLPEGTWCPTGTPYAQIKNTDEGFGELVTWAEGIFLHYFPSACLTRAYEMRKYLVDNKLPMNRFHSFGFRGHKSLEDAYWAGTAWSMMLEGTDDFHIRQHLPKEIKMSSISALAHKVTQQYDNEIECFKNAIRKASENGTGIVALVIDTYDAWNIIANHVVNLTKFANDLGVFVVWRPDSDDILMQADSIYYETAEVGLTNCAVILGEGMSFEAIKNADAFFKGNNVPLDFISYGVGAGFYKDIERDTHGQAMKTAFSNGKPRMKLVSGNPFKQSIPNEVHLLRNDYGDIVVHDGKGYGKEKNSI